MNVVNMMEEILANPYLQKMGWFASVAQQKVIDGEGNPLPWMTYPAIELLQERVPESIRVFEYGCGYGTMWWGRRVYKVVAVEHDRQWYENMMPQMPDNVHLIHRELVYGGEYCKTVSQIRGVKFHIVVIDGRDRVNCARHCLPSLTEDGVVIFDNTDRDAYIPGRDFLKNNGYKELRLSGLAPMVLCIGSVTSIFYRDGNCLNI